MLVTASVCELGVDAGSADGAELDDALEPAGGVVFDSGGDDREEPHAASPPSTRIASGQERDMARS